MAVAGGVQVSRNPLSAVVACSAVGGVGPAPPTPTLTIGWPDSSTPFWRMMAHTLVEIGVVRAVEQLPPFAAAVRMPRSRRSAFPT